MIISYFPMGGGGDSALTPPSYTYTGESALVEDEGGWKIRFLTSGKLTLDKPTKVDIFAVGGGGSGGAYSYGAGGGGGGYTGLVTNVELTAGQEYTITIGAGGSNSSPNYYGDGGASSFGGYLTANGGLYPRSSGAAGGNGGSGGGAGAYSAGAITGAGGSDGSSSSGTGQGTTTREFHEPTGALYAGGGGGCAGSSRVGEGGEGGEGGGGKGGKRNGYAGKAGEANTGGGGGGGMQYTSDDVNVGVGRGGSGIVIIRNARG